MLRAMTEPSPPERALAQLTAAVVAALPALRARVPAAPAAELGRLGVTRVQPPGSVADAVRELAPLLTERLVGALELAVESMDIEVPADLVAAVPRTGAVAIASMPLRGAAANGVSIVDQLRPGLTGAIARLVGSVADRGELASLLAVEPGDEETVAARHGASYLALAVVVTAGALRPVRSPMLGPPAVIGVAAAVAVLLLRTRPMPAAYADAVLARQRAEYRLPMGGLIDAIVRDHWFALTEADVEPMPDFVGNGLVSVVADGIVVRTGVADGAVPVVLSVVERPPALDPRVGWDEVIEVSWQAPRGGAMVPPAHDLHAVPVRVAAPPWPGAYRARVHARGRDGDDRERYEVVVWQAPAEPEVVHARRDQLGHRLRGEPVPLTVVPGHAVYRWFEHHWLAEASTITVVRGASVDEVLRGFGADPARPQPMTGMQEDLGIDPWVSVLEVGDVVLAVEPNGWQGAQSPVLRAVSRGGVAASMYRNVNAVSRLSFAVDGAVPASFEPGLDDAPGALGDVLAGLEFGDYEHVWSKALTAIERFTGHGLDEQDMAELLAADVGYAILPRLPELHPVVRTDLRGWHALGDLTETVAALPDDRLRVLAWRVAQRVVARQGMADDPEVARALTERRLDGEAARRARGAQLRGRSEPHWLWMTVHAATNPNPLAAALGALQAASYAVPGFLDDIRGELRGA
jgi:hypothetical protein